MRLVLCYLKTYTFWCSAFLQSLNVLIMYVLAFSFILYTVWMLGFGAAGGKEVSFFKQRKRENYSFVLLCLPQFETAAASSSTEL